MTIRFVDEQGNPAEYRPAPQPPYHLLVVGQKSRHAYDKDGNEVDERTGAVIKPVAPIPQVTESDPAEIVVEADRETVQPIRKRGPGRPRKIP